MINSIFSDLDAIKSKVEHAKLNYCKKSFNLLEKEILRVNLEDSDFLNAPKH